MKLVLVGTWNICTRLSVRRRAWVLQVSCRLPSTVIAEKVDVPATPTACTTTLPPRALLLTPSTLHPRCKPPQPDTMAWHHPLAQIWRETQVWQSVCCVTFVILPDLISDWYIHVGVYIVLYRYIVSPSYWVINKLPPTVAALWWTRGVSDTACYELLPFYLKGNCHFSLCCWHDI